MKKPYKLPYIDLTEFREKDVLALSTQKDDPYLTDVYSPNDWI